MAHLIDKDALVAEIESLRKYYIEKGDYDNGWNFALDKILSLIDTLEVKEVDLEKEVNNWRHEHFHGRRDKEADGEYLERVSQLDLAKHFFELGLKAQKGEET